MDFVKKNLGLLICGVISFILACVIMVFMVKTAGRMKKQNQKVTEQMTFFERVAEGGYKLTAEPGAELENLLQAKKNFEDAEQFYRGSRDFLAKSYAIETVLPLTSPDALKQINEKIRQMTEFVLKNRINFPGLAKEFSAIVARGSVNSSEFGPVFRQLQIYEYLLQKIAEAGIQQVNQLEWPMGFAVQEEDIYTITPIWLSLSCEMDVAQNFLNQMTNDRKMLFYIKCVTFLAPDLYLPVVMEYKANNTERNRGMMQGAGMATGEFPGQGGMAMPPEEAMGRRSAPGMRTAMGSGMNSADPMANLGDRNPAGTMTSAAVKSRLIVPDPKRQDFLVFGKKYVTLEVRFDLYEFKKLD